MKHDVRCPLANQAGPSCYLIQPTFLPSNGSMSNMMDWKLVDPTSDEIPRHCWLQQIRKSQNEGNEIKHMLFSESKTWRRAKAAKTRFGEHTLFIPKSRTSPSPPNHMQSHRNQSKPQIGLVEIPRFPSSDVKLYPNLKTIEPKMMPRSISIHWNAQH